MKLHAERYFHLQRGDHFAFGRLRLFTLLLFILLLFLIINVCQRQISRLCRNVKTLKLFFHYMNIQEEPQTSEEPRVSPLQKLIFMVTQNVSFHEDVVTVCLFTTRS